MSKLLVCASIRLRKSFLGFMVSSSKGCIRVHYKEDQVFSVRYVCGCIRVHYKEVNRCLASLILMVQILQNLFINVSKIN
jgi:hypothetical protein